MQLRPQPQRQRLEIRLETRRREGGVGLDEPVELRARLVVEADVVEIDRRNPRLAQALGDRVGRENDGRASCA